MTEPLLRGWTLKPLSETLTVVRNTVRPDQISDDHLFIGLEHIQSGTGEYSGTEAINSGIKSNKFMFLPGDILYGKLRPNLRKCTVSQHKGICSTDIIPLRPNEPASAEFIALQLRSSFFTSQVMQMIGGANLPRINVKDLLNLQLPEPPPADKHRLCSLAEMVMALRRKKRKLETSIGLIEDAAAAVCLGQTAYDF